VGYKVGKEVITNGTLTPDQTDTKTLTD